MTDANPLSKTSEGDIKAFLAFWVMARSMKL